MPHNDDPHTPFTTALEEALRSIAALRDKPWTVTPLEGGITNRNFRLDVDTESFVLRVAGSGTELLGIDRQCEHLCAQAAAASGAGCEVVAFLPEQGAMLTRYAPGIALEAGSTEDAALLGRAVRALVRFHGSSPVPGRFCPFRTVERYLKIARQHGVQVPEDVDAVLAHLAKIEPELTDGGELCPCHNDLLPANLIDDGERSADHRLGIRRDGRPLLRPGKPGRKPRDVGGRRNAAA